MVTSEENKIYHLIKGAIKGAKKPKNDSRGDYLTGLTFLLLLTGEACQSILDWSDLDTEEEMMEILTEPLKHPKKLDRKAFSQHDVMKIGTVAISCPSVDDWTIVKFFNQIESNRSALCLK